LNIARSYTLVKSWAAAADSTQTTTTTTISDRRYEDDEVGGDIQQANDEYVPGISSAVGPEAQFSEMARLSLARAFFCSNPQYSENMVDGLQDLDGNPLCTDRANYVAQQDRISILRISRGSILIKFEIAANRTETEISAPQLYQVMQAKLEDPNSDIRHDPDFGQFATVSEMTELPFSEDDNTQEQAELAFEEERKKYTPENICELYQDKARGIDPCEKSFSVRAFSSAFVAMALSVGIAVCFFEGMILFEDLIISLF
jgi:hypothetical protein